ncbi:phytanoyl-CoA dioxygenase family protein [Stigmatella aurantiaca]|uniref:Phytanoyl-CoA dioxygenase (PhyH) superfamily n=1 Tax=Stigmatella aurantiaca (strain DW4/3-1) TaxID=378806 RepID=Q091A1_STIAD|nr:phytanoyl-CoA dioxygenase family protein [Stigmatella aurantiaca]ADO71685.1 Phytanoyl-CoA dioxygenase (PhyH) superfamily [Stigmatella aurantiaca DW4/3-1]EAU66290.1 phytanoyl-CoA dioxygenase (PhyH) superfamily [Stigmatella aurantiaca DW4/3-1]
MRADEIVERVRAEGWCIVEGIIPALDLPEVQAEVREELDRQSAGWSAEVSRISNAGFQMPPKGIVHAQAVINRLPWLARHVANPLLIEAGEALLGRYFKVSSVGAIVTYPGNERGYWHADWPFNQKLATTLPSPYPDAVMNLSAIFMLSPFNKQTGGTILLPGSHRRSHNPSGGSHTEQFEPHSAEVTASGKPGDVLFYDSRLWHCVAPNLSAGPRMALNVRYSAWWLNLEFRRKGSPEYERLLRDSKGKDNSVPLIPQAAFDSMPESAKPFFAHWVER